MGRGCPYRRNGAGNVAQGASSRSQSASKELERMEENGRIKVRSEELCVPRQAPGDWDRDTGGSVEGPTEVGGH